MLIFQFIFIAINYTYVYVIFLYNIVFKIKYINFINLFMFGFFKVHILLFYITSIIGSFIILNYNYTQVKIKLNNNIFFITIAFIFGSLWSLYLFNWGYYWTNDSIEYVLLFFILYQLINIHLWKKKNYFIGIYLILNLYVLLMIRLNIIYTRHNFFQQNTLIYFNIKLLWIFIIQNFIYFNSISKFFIHKFNVWILWFYFLVFLIIVNFINLFFLKLLMYNIYVFIFILFVLANRWSISKYLYTHIISFCIYMCFIVTVLCYIFSFNLSIFNNLNSFYNYFFIKYITNLKYLNNLFFFNNLNNNILFNKWEGSLFLENKLFISKKKLINFIV